MWKPVLLGIAAAIACRADVANCACDPANPESMKARQCSLCSEAEKHPGDVEFFFLKDNNPRKPNRWLLLPRSHKHDGPVTLHGMTAAQRTRIWEAAMRRAQELWGDEWALAINGDKVRTQCHGHIHIGKLLKGVELDRRFIVVPSARNIPLPKDGTGLWIHPVGGKLHVHLQEQTCETVLLR